MAEVLLRTKSLRVGYKTRKKKEHAVAGPLDLEFCAGELVCLVGPNGSGKSTLLRTLAGLQEPLAGSLDLMGVPLESLTLRERAQKVAVVLTRFIGVHGMSGFDSVALGRSPHTGMLDALSEADRSSVLQSLRDTDTIHLKDRGVDALSDGERQRLAIARALAQEARMILLDEPTAFLDLPHRVGLMGLLRNLCRKQGVGAFLSTHDLDLALRFADRVLVMDGRGGVAYGIPETLALEGVFDRVFSTPQATFDLVSGSFRLEEEGCVAVCCSGSGILGAWTRRALRRKGWLLADDVLPRIDILEETGATVWRVTRNDRDVREVYNLEALLELLQNAKVPQ